MSEDSSGSGRDAERGRHVPASYRMGSLGDTVERHLNDVERSSTVDSTQRSSAWR
jgi:hypothetical protein